MLLKAFSVGGVSLVLLLFGGCCLVSSFLFVVGLIHFFILVSHCCCCCFEFALFVVVWVGSSLFVGLSKACRVSATLALTGCGLSAKIKFCWLNAVCQ